MVWWLVAGVCICLPLLMGLSSSRTSSGPTASTIDFEIRELNLLWRVVRSGRNTIEAEHKRERKAVSKELTAALDSSRDGHRTVLKELFERALRADRNRQPDNKDDQIDSAGAGEMVIAHAIATEHDDIALELASQLAHTSEDLRVALMVARPDKPKATPSRSTQRASEHAHASNFGITWSRFTRDRIRARLHVKAGDLDLAREAHNRLHDNEDLVLATFRTLMLWLMCAGLFGLFSLVLILVSKAAASKHPERPRLGFLRRFSGLGSASVYHTDPLVPWLGFATWVIGYLAAGTLIVSITAGRGGGGLSALFQSAAGIVLAWAVISAFSRVQPAIDAARLMGGTEVSPARASTAGLWGYCALLPCMLPALLIAQGLSSGDAPGHPLVETVLKDADPVGLMSVGLAVIIAAPIGEELLFRGFLYRALRQHVKVPLALAMTGGLFAILHMSPAQWLPYTVLGVAFGWIYERVGSLWAPIVLHALWNAVMYVGLVLVALS